MCNAYSYMYTYVYAYQLLTGWMDDMIKIMMIKCNQDD